MIYCPVSATTTRRISLLRKQQTTSHLQGRLGTQPDRIEVTLELVGNGSRLSGNQTLQPWREKNVASGHLEIFKCLMAIAETDLDVPVATILLEKRLSENKSWRTVYFKRMKQQIYQKVYLGSLPRLLKSSIPERIRTSNLRLRRPTLYPIELRGRMDFCHLVSFEF